MIFGLLKKTKENKVLKCYLLSS